jgi:hypothetical protein
MAGEDGSARPHISVAVGKTTARLLHAVKACSHCCEFDCIAENDCTAVG